jgi:squalene-hopene/tetraprenyl-beta-curcumene cyclase
VNFLVKTQNSAGTWDEELATGTGFPGVFYLKYHMYRHSFPLLALNTFVRTKVNQYREERSAVRSGARG